VLIIEVNFNSRRERLLDENIPKEVLLSMMGVGRMIKCDMKNKYTQSAITKKNGREADPLSGTPIP